MNTQVKTTFKDRIAVHDLDRKVLIKINMNHLEEANFESFLASVQATIEENYYERNQLVYTLAFVKDAVSTPKVMKYLAEYSKRTRDMIALEAVVGVTGFKKALLKMHNNLTRGNVIPFNSEDEAIHHIEQF